MRHATVACCRKKVEIMREREREKGARRERDFKSHQGALKHGRGDDSEGPDLCVMRVPSSHLLSKCLFVLIKNGGSK